MVWVDASPLQFSLHVELIGKSVAPINKMLIPNMYMYICTYMDVRTLMEVRGPKYE